MANRRSFNIDMEEMENPYGNMDNPYGQMYSGVKAEEKPEVKEAVEANEKPKPSPKAVKKAAVTKEAPATKQGKELRSERIYVNVTKTDLEDISMLAGYYHMSVTGFLHELVIRRIEAEKETIGLLKELEERKLGFK